MAHLRPRFAKPSLEKLAKLWPVVGLLGPRQCGKSTLMETLLGIEPSLSFDELELREELKASPKAFLARISLPAVFDEAQKAPELFDAIKRHVDQKRVPGRFFLTGSSGFSSKVGIRESLTGRIGIQELFPLSLAELHQRPFLKNSSWAPVDGGKPRFSSADLLKAADRGGMPIPCFLRDPDQFSAYWRSWLETTLYRDLARFFSRGYDADFAYALLRRIGALLAEGELPTLRHFKDPARKVRSYFAAMEEIFLLRKVASHPAGIGKDCWILMDSGLAGYLMDGAKGEGSMLSLTRHFLWNEWACREEYQNRKLLRTYYKSARGSPVDAVLGGIPFRIVANVAGVTRQTKWEERPLAAAMKKIEAKHGFLVGPVDAPSLPPKKGGIGVLPWSWWS